MGLLTINVLEKEFVDLIQNSDIVILSESWTNNLSEIDIDGTYAIIYFANLYTEELKEIVGALLFI